MGKIPAIVIAVILHLGICVLSLETEFGKADLKTFIGIHNFLCDGTRLCGNYQTANRTYYELLIPIEIPTFIDGSCCGGCSCDIENCIFSATCCPDSFDHVPTIRESFERTTATCDYAQLFENLPAFQRAEGTPIMMIRKCSNDFVVKESDDANTKDKCENPINYDSLDTKIPVTDLHALKTYENIYCLKCSYGTESQIIQWDMFVECSNFGEEVDLFIKHKGNIVEAVKDSRGCNIIYKKPEDKAPKLKGLFGCNYVINQCNFTGKWKVYDPLIEAACHAYISVYGKYSNVFCALCNEPFISDRCQPTLPNAAYPSFSALLKFSENKVTEASSTVKVDRCLENQVFDGWKNKCRNLSCRFPKIFEKGKCVNGVGTIKGISYSVYMQLRPDIVLSISELSEVTVLLDVYVKNILSKLGMGNMVFHYNSYYKERTPVNVNQPLEDDERNNNSIQNNEFSMPTVPEISAQTTLVLIEYFLFYIQIFFPPWFNNTSLDTVDEVLRYDGHTEYLNNSTPGFSAIYNISLEDFRHDGIESNPELKDVNDNKNRESIHLHYDYYDFNTGMLEFEPSKLVPVVLAEKTRCSLIEIKQEEYSVKRKWNELYFCELNMTVPLKYIFEMNTAEGVTYLICADFYLKRIEDIVGIVETFKDDESKPTTQALLSIVCISLSLLCNLVTLITYSLFKELRSQPGINNICLVICLAFAQCLFQFGLMLSKHLGSLFCIALGISIHFFWLMVMFWMNVCSFHMFKCLRNSTKMRSHSGNCQTTTTYMIYTVLASVLFIAINIIESSVTSGNVDIGYSSETCYISRPAMVGFVFALPVGIVILINLVLFVIVIVSVCRAPTINTKHDVSRNYFKIYAKLSTITGITWLFGFIYFFTDVALLEYLFIIFNASQGIFVCAAFISKKRVFELYRARFYRPNHKNKDVS